jgi:hypothetical protein
MTNAIDPRALRRRVDSIGDEPPRSPVASSAETQRSERVVAYERYEDFVAGNPDSKPTVLQHFLGSLSGKPNCESDSYQDRDFDHCGTETIPRPVLFAKQGAELDEVEPSDVLQSGLGDCYLLAPLIAMANVPEGRATIKAAIAERSIEAGTPVYTVTLHRRDPILQDSFVPVQVTVSGVYAHGQAEPRDAGELHEVWPAVIEKAYAQYLGGYNQIARGGSVAFAMETLTGKPAEVIVLEPPLGPVTSLVQTALRALRIMPSGPGYAAHRLKSDLDTHKLVVFVSHPVLAVPNERGVSGFHAYAVVGMQDGADGPVVKVRDPLDAMGQSLSIPYGELSHWFKFASVGSAR